MIKATAMIRPAKESDLNFLFDSFLKNNWYDKRNSTLLPKKIWQEAQRKKLAKIFANDQIKIACFSEDPDLIIGYGFLEPTRDQSFIYIKKHYRDLPENFESMLKQSIEEQL
ncbi:hypothetical protein EBU91_04905 [bacterium]|nr:hypothetical protein [bacterium]